MDLKERLRLLQAAGKSKPRPEGEAQALQETLRLAPAPPPSAPAAGPLPGGCAIETPSGAAYYVEHVYPAEHRRGIPLVSALDVPGAAWALLGRQPYLRQLDLRRAVFLDTETTGLAGGVGTYAFLVGLGWFDGDSFRLRQYFLRDLDEEPAMLTAIAADLQERESLVTFNGKSFDWPLLQTRFTFHRRRLPGLAEQHLDLLHPARRLWKDSLPSCSLGALEGAVLGLQRQGDTPGWLIPTLYFDYLRTGNAAPLHGIAEHNRLDILSLAALSGYLGAVVTAPLAATPMGAPLPAAVLVAMARLLDDRGDLAGAVGCLEAALTRGADAAARRLLATLYKRLREHSRAVEIWQALIGSGDGLTLHPYVELAKYYEHQAKDAAQARELVLQAIRAVERRRSLQPFAYKATAAADLAELNKRLNRLEAKLARRSAQAGLL